MITEDFIADILGHGPRVSGYGKPTPEKPASERPKPADSDAPVSAWEKSLQDVYREPEEGGEGGEEEEDTGPFSAGEIEKLMKQAQEQPEPEPEKYGLPYSKKRRSRSAMPSAIESHNRFVSLLNEALSLV